MCFVLKPTSIYDFSVRRVCCLSFTHGGICAIFFCPYYKGLKQVYAAGVYMFAEHYLMCQLHLEMAVCLNDQNDNTGVTRAGEAAYHLHQMLVGHITMLGRYGML